MLQEVRRLLVELGFIETLIDFYLGPQSPKARGEKLKRQEIGDKTTPAPLSRTCFIVFYTFL